MDKQQTRRSSSSASTKPKTKSVYASVGFEQGFACLVLSGRKAQSRVAGKNRVGVRTAITAIKKRGQFSAAEKAFLADYIVKNPKLAEPFYDAVIAYPEGTAKAKTTATARKATAKAKVAKSGLTDEALAAIIAKAVAAAIKAQG